MAAPEGSPGGSSSRNKRVLIAVGLLAAVLVGYLLFRRPSSSPASTGSSAAPTPSDTSGSGSGGAPGADASLLAALAGENQQLLGAFLQSEQGLITLAGSS